MNMSPAAENSAGRLRAATCKLASQPRARSLALLARHPRREKVDERRQRHRLKLLVRFRARRSPPRKLAERLLLRLTQLCHQLPQLLGFIWREVPDAKP